MARRAEEIHGIEPANQRRPRVVQDGASGGVHMMTAIRANERAAGGELVVGAFLTARTALKAGAAKSHLHDVGKAGLIVGEALEELADRELRGGGRAFLAHANLMAQTHTCVKGINGIFFDGNGLFLIWN